MRERNVLIVGAIFTYKKKQKNVRYRTYMHTSTTCGCLSASLPFRYRPPLLSSLFTSLFAAVHYINITTSLLWKGWANALFFFIAACCCCHRYRHHRHRLRRPRSSYTRCATAGWGWSLSSSSATGCPWNPVAAVAARHGGDWTSRTGSGRDVHPTR